MVNKRNSTIRAARGFTLIEVLIAFLLLAIGVLGLAGTQLSSLKFNQTSSGRTQASFLAYSIADAMRANKANAASYDIAIGTADPTGSSIAETDITNWRASLKTQLPDGKGSIAHGTGADSKKITITVQWSEGRVGRSNEIDAAGADTQTFTMVTQL